MSALFEFAIQSGSGSYAVSIGAGTFDPPVEVKCLADAALLPLFPQISKLAPITMFAVETAKSLATVAEVIEQLRSQGANRQSHLVAVGGGIVQDIATFSASSYMRGIQWTYCPTTLLGMVDSCIGGKSSINVGKFKNIAGNFYPPQKVLVDTNFCKTLSPTQRVEGLCEAAKICFASTESAFDEYLALESVNSLGDSDFDFGPVIALSLATKKKFIEEDEFDLGVRQLLNFGHTFGHALEGAADYRISHGVAVGLGMLAALRFSEAEGLIKTDHSRTRALSEHVRTLLSALEGDLAGLLRSISIQNALEHLASDKKHTRESFMLILPVGDGHLERRAFPKSESALTAIGNALRALPDELRHH